MNTQTVLLLYEKNHTNHPFIKLLLGSLKDYYPDIRIIVASFAPKKDVKDGSLDSFICLTQWKKPKLQNLAFARRAYGANSFSRTLISYAHDIFDKFKPDVILTFLPLGFFAAQTWAMFHGCRSVYYPFEIYGKQKSKYSRWVVMMEILGFLLKPDAVITQNEHRAQFYVKNRYCRSKLFVAHNYKTRPRSSVRPIDFFEMHGIPSEKKVVLYQGMLSDGRWLDRLVASAKYFRDDAILVLMGKKQQPWWSDNIEPLLHDPAVSDRVVVLESVPHEMVFSYARASSVGVVIYDDLVLNNIYCEPGKLGDFVHAGVPVIAPAFPSIKSVVEENNLGITFSDYSSRGIASAVNELLSYPADHFASSLAKAAEYMTWEAQWPALGRQILGYD